MNPLNFSRAPETFEYKGPRGNRPPSTLLSLTTGSDSQNLHRNRHRSLTGPIYSQIPPILLLPSDLAPLDQIFFTLEETWET